MSGGEVATGWSARIRVPERDVDLEFSVAAGETVAVLDPNGAGKSTLVQSLAGLLRGASADARPPHARRVGLLAQRALLFPHLRALDNVAFGPRARGASRAQARTAALGWLERCGAAELASRWPRTLSGGQAQRVALARALATEPELLLLDEPFAALDASAVPELRELLATVLGESRIRAVLVTHQAQDTLALAQRAVVIEGGRVVQEGTVREVLAHPATEFVRRLGFGLSF